MSNKYSVEVQEDFKTETVKIRLVRKSYNGPYGRPQREAIILSLSPEWLEQNLAQIADGEHIIERRLPTTW